MPPMRSNGKSKSAAEAKNIKNATKSAGPPLSVSANSALGESEKSMAAAIVTNVPTQLIPVHRRAFPGLISFPLLNIRSRIRLITLSRAKRAAGLAA